MFWWHLADIFFVVFHTSLIVFNMTGWIWKKTRMLNLVTLLITGASWTLLGLVIGTPGYCPLTDWHFDVLGRLGKTGLPPSYIKYLFDRITGADIAASLADGITLYTFLGLLAISLYLNIRNRLKR